MRRKILFVATATMVSAVTGIASGAAASTPRRPSKAPGLTEVRVGALPIIDDAPIYVGIKEGFFAKQGIKVTPVLAESGSDIIPAVLSGSEQFGFSNNTSLVIASSKGLPVTIVSGALLAGSSTASGYSELIVRASSPIKSLADLKGKTIAVNALGNVGPLSINDALQKAGVNPSSVHYEVIPFPSMDAALEKGSAEVVWDIEPFIAVLKAEKFPFRVLANTMAAVSPHFPVSSYFASVSYLQQHRAIALRFIKALKESLAFSQAHLSVVASVLPTYTKITSKLEKLLVYPTFTPNPEVPVIRETATLALKYGYMNSAPHWSTLLKGLK
jgi:NitT/TauT family transport system substrate-binding protein